MTPLAHRIVKELTLPVKRRTFSDDIGLLNRMDGIHCFECSDVFTAARDLAIDLRRKPSFERLAFLPAPKTWIEWREPNGDRAGVLLEEIGEQAFAKLYWAVGGRFSAPLSGTLQLTNALSAGVLPSAFQAEIDAVDEEIVTYLIYAFLAMINTPRIIGRRQNMPHRGLERALVANKKLIGKFPLHAWTEIKLHVTPPRDMAGDAPVEAHLTGERALHFCRAHLRIRLGRLEIVSAHWRGNPALGMKQSRYKLVA